LFAQSASLQNLPREFRGAIGCNYHDIDMENAHPSILLQYCKKNDIKCDNLEHYVNNRNDIISRFIITYQLERSDVKQLFLSVMNGAKRDGITDDFFIKFQSECQRIHIFIASLNPKLLKDVCKRKEFNINGSLTKKILCSLENEILTYSVQYLLNEGFNVDVLVFDGCMIRKREGYSINDELLGELNGYVLEKTGYDIKFTEKPLDNSIDLSKYKIDESELEASITYFKDKEEFEKTHLKIVHPPIYISIIKGKFELQTEDGIKQIKTII
jgi:hypothetical protein